MKLKPSYYNHIEELDSGKTVLYNFLTGGLFELHKKDINNIKTILDNPNQTYNQDLAHLKKMLKEKYFLISDDCDEMDLIRYRNLSKRFNNQSGHLIIMPTMDCNFKCTYCYEAREKGFITDNVKKGIRSWISSMAKSCNSFSIGWFGGEPLLGFDTIEEINSYAQEICEENNCFFVSNITTNGYLLDSEMLSKVNDLGLSSFQITVDGTPEFHNQKRPLLNGKPTFDVVFNNVLRILDETNANVMLRVNIDKKNVDSITDLMDMIPEKYRTSRLQIYFRYIFTGYAQSKETSENIVNNRISSHELVKDLYVYAIDNGFNVMFPMLLEKDSYCSTCLKNSFTIDPKGKIFKCTIDFGDEYSVGSITEDGTINLDHMTHSRWYSHIPGSDPKCKECKFLPLCYGGCSYHRINGKRACPYESFDLKGLLELQYLAVSHSQSI